MPDLKPDLSIFSHPSQSGPGDVLGLMKGMQEYQGNQSMTDALSQSTNSQTGEVDFNKAMSVWQSLPGFKRPEQALQMIQGAQNQMQLNEHRSENIGKIWSPIANNPDATAEDVERAQILTTKVLGGGGAPAKLVNDYLHDLMPRRGQKMTPEQKRGLVDAVNNLQAAYGGTTPLTPIMDKNGVLQYMPTSELTRRALQEQQQQQQAGGGGDTPSPEQDPTLGMGPGRKVMPGDKLPPEYEAARSAAQGYTNETLPLTKAIPTLAAMGSKSTGPTSEARNAITSVAENLGWIGSKDADQTHKFQEARKYLEQWVSRASETGPNTVAHLLQTASGQPNMTLQNVPLVSLAKTALAVRRMQQVGFQEFSRLVDQGVMDPRQFPQWYARWAPQQDDRAYGMDMWNKSERDKIRASVARDPQAEDRFVASHNAAKRAKIFRRDIVWNAGTD